MKVPVARILFMIAWTSVASPNRLAEMADSDVLDVRTALSYSTVLEFDSKPTAAILGDQDAFRVEYLGNSLSIKPLLQASKTNLFVFTEYEKFNFRLSTGPSAQADFSIRVKRKRKSDKKPAPYSKDYPSQEPTPEKKLYKKVVNKGLTLTLLSVSYPQSKTAVVVRFSLLQKDESNPIVTKDDVRVTQGNESIPIHNLFLERTELNKDVPVDGILVFRVSQIKNNSPLYLEITSQGHGGSTRTLIPLEKPQAAGAK